MKKKVNKQTEFYQTNLTNYSGNEVSDKPGYIPSQTPDISKKRKIDLIL